MMRDRGSHKPFGSIADLKAAQAKPLGQCQRCGCPIEKRRTYCGPCRADAYDEKLAVRRALARQRKGRAS